MRDTHAPALARLPAGVLALLIIPLIGLGAWLWLQWTALAEALPWLAMALRVLFLGTLAATPAIGLWVTWRRWADHRYIQAHHATQLMRAERQIAPLASSFTYHVQPGAPPAQQALLAAAEAPALSSESEWLGWTDQAPHLMVAGRTDSGKTTTAEAILARRIAAGDLMLAIDPHYRPGKWLGASTIGGGRDYAACYLAFDRIRELLDKRYTSFNKGTRTEDFRRVTIIVDEVPAIITYAQTTSKALYESWLLFANGLGSEARKVRISIILLTQSPLVRDIGISSAMRENFTRIALGDTAADLLRDDPDPARKKALLELLRGRQYPAAMEYRNSWYALRNDDIRDLARSNGMVPRAPALLLPGGMPPAPAAPPAAAQQAQASTIPPTVRVPVRAAPPTLAMTITVPEQVLDLLMARGGQWMTASEIAAALQIDLGVVRTEIDTLYNKAGRLVRRKVRGKRTKETYEYQAAQSVQSVQPLLTPSA